MINILKNVFDIIFPIKNVLFMKFQKCVAMCMDRYMDAFHLVFKAYSNRLQRERNRM